MIGLPETHALVEHLRATLAKMELTLGAVDDPIAWTTADQRISWCNTAFDRLVDRPHIELLGAPVVALLPLADGANGNGDHPIRRLLDAEQWSTETHWFFAGDKKRLMEVRGAHVHLADWVSVVLVLHDVTQEHLVSEERTERIREQAIRTAAEEGVRARDEFLLIASHELKSPLTSLKLKAQLLQRRVAQLDSGDRVVRSIAEMARGVERETDRLIGLVEQLLDVTWIAAGRLALTLNDVDLSALVGEVAERLREDLATAHCPLTLQLAAQVVARCDRSRVDEVIVNLLTNAMKYGRGAPIEVTLEARPQVARIVVRDQGMGIAKSDQDRIFERFERVPSRHVGGLGLGLYISRQIIDAHMGTIRVESTPGVGTAFVVELPLRAPP